jgi:hypothetical protein
VPVDEPLAGEAFDYADAFRVLVDEPDDRTAEQWLRAGLEHAPGALRWVILVAHRHVLRFRLGPRSSPDHVLGWMVDRSTPEAARLTASGPLIEAVIVGRKIDPTGVVLTTGIDYQRRAAARFVWRLVRPLHRRVARYLLAHAASSVGRAGATGDHPALPRG